jgi:2-oxoisovalerate dehydrogenase E2 component (dihydrolipoyl transacylase)
MNLVLPEMGEGVIEATISRWLVSVGDVVERMEPVVEVETDKVTTEIVADEAGTITSILVEEGKTVAVGTVLAEIGTEKAVVIQQASVSSANGTTSVGVEGGGTTSSIRSQVGPDPFAPTAGNALAYPGSRNTLDGRVSPVVARMAAEHELDLGLIVGTGKNGRITKRDVAQFLSDKLEVTSQPLVKAEPSPQARTELPTSHLSLTTNFVPLSPMRRAIAEHMVHSVQTSPHATTVHEVDFSAVMAHRKVHKQSFADKGVKLTFTAYIMLAVAEALGQYPLVNSSWHQPEAASAGISLHQEINVGMATAVQGGAGLVVPVIKHAADYNLLGMARVVNELADKARDNRLAPADMQGGTFTVSNHGVSGSLFGTPIINQPQAAILGVGAIKKQVVVVEDGFGNDAMAIRPMALLSCSFDHRILDGVSADGFVAAIVSKLETWG